MGSEMKNLAVFPASLTRGQRYMLQNYFDGITACHKFGPPDFFITFTCNPKWNEIAEGILEAGQEPVDTDDAIIRVFNIKLEELLQDIKKVEIFGPYPAVLHTVKFQKQGLPCAHIIMWTRADTSQSIPAIIDSVSAHISDPTIDELGMAYCNMTILDEVDTQQSPIVNPSRETSDGFYELGWMSEREFIKGD